MKFVLIPQPVNQFLYVNGRKSINVRSELRSISSGPRSGRDSGLVSVSSDTRSGPQFGLGSDCSGTGSGQDCWVWARLLGLGKILRLCLKGLVQCLDLVLFGLAQGPI